VRGTSRAFVVADNFNVRQDMEFRALLHSPGVQSVIEIGAAVGGAIMMLAPRRLMKRDAPPLEEGREIWVRGLGGIVFVGNAALLCYDIVRWM
jgi:hypothetical protein